VTDAEMKRQIEELKKTEEEEIDWCR